ncbi:MAG TPA: MFS transporter [Bryobacteraceae bacterium]|nr:MFS transporter [Bryobacteraceae bacterium]
MNRISYTKRLSYAVSDTAGQLVFCVISNYLLYFYTDVYGISVGVAGTILLVARCIDGIDAPVWGFILDKTHSRFGKSRPWFLWLCVPFAVFGVLTFLSPNLGTTAKAFYAAGTYIVCGILYTGINTPVTSILSALTPDPQERVMLTTYRMIGSKAGVLIVNATALPLVAWLGRGNDRLGFTLTMPIYATGTILLFLLAFRNLEEVVKEDKKPLPVLSTFGAIKGNWPWIIIFLSSLFFWIAYISRVSAVIYYFTYVLNRKDLVPLVNSLDIVSLTAVVFMPWACRFMSKANMWALGLVGSVLGQVMMYFGQPSIPMVLGGWIFATITGGVAMAIPFSILSDSVDYGEWKTGVRAAGLLTAVGAAFCLKAGSGIGGALPAWIMAAHGYVPNVAQTASSIAGIEIGFIWLPAAFFTLSLLPVLFYHKYEVMEPQIHKALDERRAAASLELRAIHRQEG